MQTAPEQEKLMSRGQVTANRDGLYSALAVSLIRRLFGMILTSVGETTSSPV